MWRACSGAVSDVLLLPLAFALPCRPPLGSPCRSPCCCCLESRRTLWEGVRNVLSQYSPRTILAVQTARETKTRNRIR
eukprot:2663744-Rhodomonas_salina.1